MYVCSRNFESGVWNLGVFIKFGIRGLKLRLEIWNLGFEIWK